LDKFFPEGAGAASYQYSLIFKHLYTFKPG